MTGPVRLRLVIAAGGVVGASIRLAAISATGDHRGWLWLVIGVVNLIGCAVVGAALAAADRWSWPPSWRLGVTVGVCGGLTTFATVAVEVALALDDGTGPALAAMSWAVASLGLGVAAALAGRATVLRVVAR